MEPLVSVCIPTYNRERFLLRAMRSALDQTYKRIEVLVSDNASTDNTMKLLGAVQDDRLRVHRQPRNLGPERNIRWLLEHATGEYLVVLSSDDYWEPHMLETAVRRMEQETNVGIHSTRAFYETEGGRVLWSGPNVHICGKIRDPKALLQGNFVLFSSAVFRARCYELVGPVPLHPALDMILWLRILFRGWSIWLEPEPLAHYTFSHDADSIRLKDPGILEQFGTLLRETVMAGGRQDLLPRVDWFMATRWYGTGADFENQGDLLAARQCYRRALRLQPLSVKTRARWLFSYLPPGLKRKAKCLAKRMIP